MRTVTFDGLDKKWSVITLGCWQIAPSAGWGDFCSAAEADAVVKAGLDCGITAFDTAEGYGDGESERRLSKALGTKKDDVIIISKIWPDAELTAAAYEERLENTLKALNRDYVDMYLVHWPGEYFNTHQKSEKLCELMFRLKVTGKAKCIGLSNFQSGDLELLGERVSRFSVNQVPYSLVDRQYEGATRVICESSNMFYMAYSPTGQGLFGGRMDSEALRAPTRQRNPIFQEPLFSHSKKVYELVCRIGEELQRQPVEVALSWVLAQNNILTAIVGTRKPGQVPQFASAGDFTLNEAHLQELTAASDAFCENRTSMI